MAFCANCGSEATGKFCAKCGSALPQSAAPNPGPTPQGPAAGAYTPPPAGGAYQSPGGQQYQQQQYPGGYPGGANPGYAPPPGAQPAGLEENMACALCYLLGVLTGVLFLVIAPYNQNRNIRFHAFQSIFVWVGLVACFIVASILSIMLTPIPIVGFLIGLLLHFGLGIGALVLWLMLMYKAYNKERWVLPVVGPLAEKQA
jgi:uncharacterized membrane protein